MTQESQAATSHNGQSVMFGFVEGTSGDQRLVSHSGAIRGLGASLNLLPEHDAGYFLAFNAECHETSACEIIAEFWDQFLERFLR
jgi:hypothetical protein